MRKVRTSKEELFCFKNKQTKTKGQASTSKDPCTRGDCSILNEHSSFDVCLMNTNNSIVQVIHCLGLSIQGQRDMFVRTNICSKPYTRWLIEEEFLYMGNNSSIKVHGKGKLNLCLHREIS